MIIVRCSTQSEYNIKYKNYNNDYLDVVNLSQEIKKFGTETWMIVVLSIAILMSFVLTFLYVMMLDRSIFHVQSWIAIGVYGVFSFSFLVLFVFSFVIFSQMQTHQNNYELIQEKNNNMLRNFQELEDAAQLKKTEIKNNFMQHFDNLVDSNNTFLFISKIINIIEQKQNNHGVIFMKKDFSNIETLYESLVLALDNYQFLFLKDNIQNLKYLIGNFLLYIDDIIQNIDGIDNNMRNIFNQSTKGNINTLMNSALSQLEESKVLFIENIDSQTKTFDEFLLQMNKLQQVAKDNNKKNILGVFEYLNNNSILVGEAYERLKEKLKIFITFQNVSEIDEIEKLFNGFYQFIIDVDYFSENNNVSNLGSQNLNIFLTNWQEDFFEKLDFFTESISQLSVDPDYYLNLFLTLEKCQTFCVNLNLNNIQYNKIKDIIENNKNVLTQHISQLNNFKQYMNYGNDFENNLNTLKSNHDYFQQKTQEISFTTAQFTNDFEQLMAMIIDNPIIYNLETSFDFDDFKNFTLNVLNIQWVFDFNRFRLNNIEEVKTFWSKFKSGLEADVSLDVDINGISQKIKFVGFFSALNTEISNLSVIEYLNLAQENYTNLFQGITEYNGFLDKTNILQTNDNSFLTEVNNAIKTFNNQIINKDFFLQLNSRDLLFQARENMNSFSKQMVEFLPYQAELPKLSNIIQNNDDQLMSIKDFPSYNFQNLLNFPEGYKTTGFSFNLYSSAYGKFLVLNPSLNQDTDNDVFHEILQIDLT